MVLQRGYFSRFHHEGQAAHTYETADPSWRVINRSISIIFPIYIKASVALASRRPSLQPHALLIVGRRQELARVALALYVGEPTVNPRSRWSCLMQRLTLTTSHSWCSTTTTVCPVPDSPWQDAVPSTRATGKPIYMQHSSKLLGGRDYCSSCH